MPLAALILLPLLIFTLLALNVKETSFLKECILEVMNCIS